jgi:hypothetical protein
MIDRNTDSQYLQVHKTHITKNSPKMLRNIDYSIDSHATWTCLAPVPRTTYRYATILSDVFVSKSHPARLLERVDTKAVSALIRNFYQS